MEAQAHIHDAIHTILAFNCEAELTMQEKLSDIKPSNLLLTLISNVNQVPQRPPLS
ncbi:conserved hypothetical protein [Sulfurimonas gotlandica GD1]|nr:conserved hypothetical protein [Sulfurimonas gotlandica GD1]